MALNPQDVQRKIDAADRDFALYDKLIKEADLDVQREAEKVAQSSKEKDLANREMKSLEKRLYHGSSYEQQKVMHELDKLDKQIKLERDLSLRDGRPERTDRLLHKRQEIRKQLLANSTKEQKNMLSRIDRIHGQAEEGHRQYVFFEKERRRKMASANELRKKQQEIADLRKNLSEEYKAVTKESPSERVSQEALARGSQLPTEVKTSTSKAGETPAGIGQTPIGAGTPSTGTATFDSSRLPSKGLKIAGAAPIAASGSAGTRPASGLAPVAGGTQPAITGSGSQGDAGTSGFQAANKALTDSGVASSNKGTADKGLADGKRMSIPSGFAAAAGRGQIPSSSNRVIRPAGLSSGQGPTATPTPSGVAPVRTGDSSMASPTGAGQIGRMPGPLEQAKQKALGLGPTTRDMSAMRNKLRESRSQQPVSLGGGIPGEDTQSQGPKGFLGSINFGIDWMYWAAIGFALFKDIVDLVLGWIPGVGTVLGFMASIAIAMLVTMAGFMEGGGMGGVQRRMARRYITLIAGTIAEMLFGLNIIPIETMVAIAIYVMAIRARQQTGEKGSTAKPDKQAKGQKAAA